MTWIVAVTTGIGLGLASFGGLWLTVQHLVRQPQQRALMSASSLARLALVGLVLYGLSREGAHHLLGGLVGLWLARWYLLRRLGGTAHGG